MVEPAETLGPPKSDLIMQSSIARAVEVLLTVLESPKPVNAKQLARMLDLKLGTVYHVLGTLRDMHLITRQSGGLLVPGRRALLLGDALQRDGGVGEQLPALLNDLRNRSRETCYISSLVGREVVLRLGLESPETLRVATLHPGYADHPHARAAARAIFAFLPEREVRAIFKGYEFDALTSRTITDFDTLLVELDKVRALGHSVDDRELYDDICCVAAPFFDTKGSPIGSFTISAPAPRFNQNSAHLTNLVRWAADKATELSSASTRSGSTG